MANALATVPARPAQPTAQQVPQMLIPFMRGTIDHSEPFYDVTFTLGANTQNIGPIDIASYGFAKAVYCQVNVVSAANAATVALTEDAPWNIFSEIAIQDVNGSPLFGPHSGWETYAHHKYGGFRGQQDPKLFPGYVGLAVGASATAGSGTFQYRINLERNGRDGLGALANMNASQAYKLRGTLNSLAGVFATAPTVAPTVRVRFWLEAYSQPNAVDAAGRPQATVPPANQTTGFSSRIQPPTNSGATTLKHTRVGNYIRNLIYINRRAGTSRANGEADFANMQFQWYVDSRLLTNMAVEMIRARMSEQYQFVSTAFETAGGPDNGVLVLPFCTEFDGRAGYEMRDMWLPTTQATRLEMAATFPNAGVLTIMTDDVAPRGNVFLS